MILAHRPPDQPVRIWTPACASGEETDSLAISLLEFLGEKAEGTGVQLFGTDVSEAGIAKARTAVFPENIREDVSADRLRRFFIRTENGYRISKRIRDFCIFAEHNVISDPPFSQMDLICCRNLMIYMEPALQKRVISLFHYALRPNGFLVLGTSEGVGVSTNLFSLKDRANKIFAKRPAAKRPAAMRPPMRFTLNKQGESGGEGTLAARLALKQQDSQTGFDYLEAQKEFDRRLLTQFSPAAVFLNEDFEIVHTRGNVDRYLKLGSGRASLNVLKMAREGLLYDLRNALNRSKKGRVSVRKQRVQLKGSNGGATREVVFEVAPLHLNSLREMYYMVVFRDAPPAAERKHGKAEKGETRRSEATKQQIAKLEQELSATKEYLQSMVEEQEATNEELQSANEEILSSNEELQSTNEELETAKEELQSANEELTTVNDELRNRNLEMTQANNDLTNLLSSVNIAIVMLGADLTIRRFTSPAQKVLGLIPTDVGRPFGNINPTIEEPHLAATVREVMDSLKVVEKKVKDKTGTSYFMRILPYRTNEDKVEGAVLTLLESSQGI